MAGLCFISPEYFELLKKDEILRGIEAHADFFGFGQFLHLRIDPLLAILEKGFARDELALAGLLLLAIQRERRFFSQLGRRVVNARSRCRRRRNSRQGLEPVRPGKRLPSDGDGPFGGFRGLERLQRASAAYS